MRTRKWMAMLLVLAMVLTGMLYNETEVKAAENKVVVTKDMDLIVKPGETAHIKLPIRATSAYIAIPTIEVKAKDPEAPFTFTTPTISLVGTKVSGIGYGDASTDLEFDVTVKETAPIGIYPVDITFTYEDYIDGQKTVTLNTEFRILEEKVPAQLTIDNVKLTNTNIGSYSELSFWIKNEGEITAKSAYIELDYTTNNTGIKESYTVRKIKIDDLASGDLYNVTLPISIKSDATVGSKAIIANFEYKTTYGDTVKSSYNIYVNLTTSEKAPKLILDDVTLPDSLKPGDDFKVSLDLKNIGIGTASDIVVSVDDSSISPEGILRNYYTDGVTSANIAKDATKKVEVPLAISKYATGGLKSLKIKVDYKDDKGIAYSIDNTVYVDVVGEATVGSPNLAIRNVSQSPVSPIAGGNVKISFRLENKSKVDATDVKIYTTGLTGNTFIPTDSEPYQYIEKLEGGKYIDVTIDLKVSDDIPEGLNNLTVECTSGNGGKVSEIIPVLNVQNEKQDFSSKPKLIVSNYTADVEELRAGSIFNLTFDIYNTNAAVAAKNITITVTEPAGSQKIFSPTKGSNSFFVNKLDPGETVSNTIEMKIKSDASTNAYPISIQVEYEYDGAEPNKTTGEIGETKSYDVNLQVVENSRPVVDYVNVYSWDGGVTVGNVASLAFEFYNMGKSQLNNVIATVEGDLMKADGNMYFLGNVMAGSSSYVEFDVIPNIEGTANGILKITFEDSNGDEVEFTKEFQTQVMGAGVIDPGFPGGDPGGEVFNPEVPVAKKEILPVWLFVIILVVGFIAFIPITRKIIISVYKAKLRKREQDQY